jgi:transcriptional regulator
MHHASAFSETDPARLAAFVAERGFAILTTAPEGRPVCAHAPVLLSDGRLRFHLSAMSPLTAALRDGAWVLAVVSGPDAYVSPDWYAAPDQVPTWNYVSVEAEGPVRVLPPAATARMLDDLSAHFEARLAPKAPWTRAKMTPARFEAMLGAIVGFEIAVERLEGVWKLSQNKPAEAARVVAALKARPDAGSQAIAALMREL